MKFHIHEKEGATIINRPQKRMYKQKLKAKGFAQQDIDIFLRHKELMELGGELPEGTKVTLNIEQIKSSPDYPKLTEKYRTWLETHKDNTFTVEYDNEYSRIGVFKGNSVRFKDGYSSYSELYLVENPCREELSIKEKIISELNKQEKLKFDKEIERKSKKTIHAKDLIIGKEYIDDRGDKYLYLGSGVVTKFREHINSNYSPQIESKEEGYIYVRTKWNYLTKEWDSTYKVNYETLERFEVRKSKKRLVEKTENELNDISSVMEVVEEKEFCKSRYSNNSRGRIKIELKETTN